VPPEELWKIDRKICSRAALADRSQPDSTGSSILSVAPKNSKEVIVKERRNEKYKRRVREASFALVLLGLFITLD
jgi:hypothetical protein